MRRGPEIAGDLVMAGIASFRADKLRAGNHGWRNDGPICFERTAGKQNEG